MQALQFSAFGDPLQSIELVDLPAPPAPGDGEVLVDVEYSPINQWELLMVRGHYGVRPPLPASLGYEGVGRVRAVGNNVFSVKVGDRVSLPNDCRCWREQVLVSAKDLLLVPRHVDPQQLSMLRVNPPTAALLLSEFAQLAPGDWVIQNAANSGVGRSVIAYARHRGLRTVNLVRRESLVDELTRYGGDVVLVDDPKIAQRVADATQRAKITLAVDAVAGEAVVSLTSCLAEGGTLVTYGGMSGQPGVLNPLHVIFRDVRVQGFWLLHPRWAAGPKVESALREAIPLIADGTLHVPVAGAYELAHFKDAIAHAVKGGKVLFKPS